MNLYYLFVYEEYDSRGGWGDFVGTFITIEQAKGYLKLHPQRFAEGANYLYQIVEIGTMRIIERGRFVREDNTIALNKG